MIVTKVSFEKASAKMKALATVLHRPLREVLESGARVAAISCARTSQPFGTGAEALKAGENAVARDIARVYRTPGAAWKDIGDPRAQAAFWRAFQAGEFEGAQIILQEHGSELRDVRLQPFDGGAAHRAARDPGTGRVRAGRAAMIVLEGGGVGSELAGYVIKRQGNVGFGKGGWADVARQISGNGARGLKQEGDISAGWITRKGQGYGKVFRSGSDENPTITIVSAIPYASNILQGTGKSDAIRIARERMILNLKTAIEYETRALRSAA